MRRFVIAILFAIVAAVTLQASCSSSIGKASINELGATGGNNFIEVVRLDPTLNVSGWSLYLCNGANKNGCTAFPLSTASSATDPSTGRTYYVVDIGSAGQIDNIQVVLLNGSNQTVDFLNASGKSVYTDLSSYSTNCAFQYDTAISPVSADKLIFRGPDGTGDWDIVTKNGNASGFITKDATNNSNPYCTIPDYNLTKTVDQTEPSVGGSVNYTLTVTNKGCLPPDTATLTDTLPANVTTTGSTSWSVSPLAYGASQNYTLTATVTGGGGSILTNNATVTIGSENTNTLSDNSASVDINPIPLPIAEYRFESSTPIDSSGNNLNGTNNGGVTSGVEGKVCSAYNFNGLNAFVSIPHNTSLNLTRITISAWVRHTSSTFKSWEAILAKGDSAYRLHLNGKVNCSINSPQTANGFDFGLNAGCNSADIDSNVVPSTNQWYHVVGTYDGSSIKIYVDNVLKASATYSGTIGSNTFPLYIGENSQRSGRFWTGDIDEVKIFNKALSAKQINTIYTNESNGLRWDGSDAGCYVPPSPTCTAFQYDLYHRYDTAYHLHTRLSQTPFDVNATVTCAGSGEIPARKIQKIYAISGTCPSSSAGLSPIWSGSTDINDTVRTVTLSGLNIPKAYSSLRLMLETNSGELNCSTDTMSVRPSGYLLFASSIKAGDNVNISALNGGGNYNGTTAITTDLQSVNANCPTQNTFLSTSEPYPLTFVADTNNSTLTARDIGSINVYAKDNTWTQTDQSGTTWDCIANSNTTVPDGYGLGRLGCDINSTLPLTINPYELKTTLNSFKTPLSTPTNWLYLDSGRIQNVEINSTTRALSSDGTTVTKNFSSGCSGNTMPFGYYFSNAGTIPADVNISLTASTGSTSNIYDNIGTYTTRFNTQFFSVPNASFTNGDANLSLKFNFLRAPNTPYNPFTLTLNDINSSYSGGVIDLNATALSNGATFVYGRVHPYDITTNNITVPNPVELEIYSSISTGFVAGMPQNVLHWYRNTAHDDNSTGQIYAGSATSLTIDTSASPLNGQDPIQITYNDTAAYTTGVKLDIPEWLWYSPSGKAYDYVSADCKAHPCFLYRYIPIPAGSSDTLSNTGGTSAGVESGTFNGADFTILKSQNTSSRGVKLFR